MQAKEPKPEVQPASIVSVLGLAASALFPGIMGLLFFLSLGLSSPHGALFPNGTYVRPDSEAFGFGGFKLWGSASCPPLLISSLSSSLIDWITPLVMMLLAYHLAHQWLRFSRMPSKFDILPSPFQYFLTMDFINNSSTLALLRFLYYALKPALSDLGRPSIMGKSPRAKLSPIVKIAAAGLASVLAFTWSIKTWDILNHHYIIPVIQMVTRPMAHFKGAAELVDGCENHVSDDCGVANRFLRARAGGENASDEFKVYEAKDRTSASSISFIGPVNPDPAISGNRIHTFAASTVCEALRPECFVSGTVVQSCRPEAQSLYGIGLWNAAVYDPGFDTSVWRNRLQSFMTVRSDLPTSQGDTPAYGALVNPFTIATFGCFPNHSKFASDNRDPNNPTPFINWGRYDRFYPRELMLMCTVLVCNTTVYDGQYNLAQGKVSLVPETLTLASPSVTLAISGAATYRGSHDSTWYQYLTGYMDEQLQADLTSTGNRFGNDSGLFAAAWAQSLSNRLTGWSAGAVELRSCPTKQTRPELATSIPLWIAYSFLAFHLLFAIFILLLAVSTFLLPGILGRRFLSTVEKDDIENEFPSEKRALMSDGLAIAQDRLSNPSSLIHELVIKRSQDQNSSSYPHLSSRPFPHNLSHQPLFSQRPIPCAASQFGLEFAKVENIRVALVPDPLVGLGLSFSQ